MANIFNLLGPIVLGIAAAGVLLFLKRILRIPLPGWTIPVFAAFAILAGHLYNEYTWFPRLSAQLPEGAVIDTGTASGPLEPWTLLWPRINRFSAVDTRSVRTHPDHPGVVMADILLVQRYTKTVRIGMIADCGQNRTAEIPADPQFGEDGLPTDLVWTDREPDNAFLEALCRLGESRTAA